MVPLEDMSDFNVVAKKPKMEPTGTNIEECNIGTEKNPKIIKLSKSLTIVTKQRYIALFKEFIYVFSWSCEDLKSYDTSIIQHKIPIKEDQKPFKQKLRTMNHVLKPLAKKEIKKMYESKNIVPLRYSKWVSNIVPTIKKTCEI